MSDALDAPARMAGAGNRFAVYATADEEPDSRTLAAGLELCRTERLDGLLFVSRSSEADADLRMIVVNADGSRPEACGNGLRCAAVFGVRAGLARGPALRVRTDSGVRRAELLADGTVRASLGSAVVREFEFVLGGSGRRAFEVLVGNPHVVVFAEEGEPVSLADLAAPEGPLRSLARFPDGVNVELARPRPARDPAGRPSYLVEVDERGVGPTEACGTGACAVAAAAWRSGAVPAGVEVGLDFPGGSLGVSRETERGELWLRGPVVWMDATCDATRDATRTEEEAR